MVRSDGREGPSKTRRKRGSDGTEAILGVVGEITDHIFYANYKQYWACDLYYELGGQGPGTT